MANEIDDIVDVLNSAAKAANPNLEGRLINVLDVGSESQTFKIMKRVRDTVYYYNPVTGTKTIMLVVQEVMRIPSGEKEAVMKEFAKRFLATTFMWATSKEYSDLINGKFESKQRSDPDRGA